MSTIHLCEVCDQPIDLCECGNCKNCDAKIDGGEFCSEECKQEFRGLVDDKIRHNSKEDY